MNKSQSKIVIYIAAISLASLIIFSLMNITFYKPTYDEKDVRIPKFDNFFELENFIMSKSNSRRYLYDIMPALDAGKTEQAELSSQITDYSSTNVQVGGIDESDLVKTDGQYIYFVNGSYIEIIKAYPIDELSHVSRINLSNFNVQGIYLDYDNNFLIAIISRYTYVILDYTVETTTVGDAESGESLKILPPDRIKPPISSILVFDIENHSYPVLYYNISFEGDVIQSRLYKNTLYINNVQNPYAYYESGEKVKLPIFWINNKMKFIDAHEIMYIPQVNDNYLLYNIVFAINLNDMSFSYQAVLIGSTGVLYMSYNNIYLAQTVYPKVYPVRRFAGEPLELINSDVVKSVILRFRVLGINISLEAVGMVEGVINSQFQLDEYRGFLRVSTYTWSWSGNRTEQYTNLYVLDENLTVIGNITKLGKSEMLYSTRFMGDYAYLVTFRIIDPFFVIDLTDPRNPYVIGELKIPGFSTYLHPVNNDLVLGLGYETNNETRITGLKISLFDISDPANPREIDKIILNRSEWVWSEALYNHKAVMVIQNKNIIGFSVVFYGVKLSNESHFESLYSYILVQIEETGLEIYKLLTVNQLQIKRGFGGSIRGIYIDSYLYIISNGGLLVYNLDTVEKILSL